MANRIAATAAAFTFTVALVLIIALTLSSNSDSRQSSGYEDRTTQLSKQALENQRIYDSCLKRWGRHTDTEETHFQRCLQAGR